MPDSTHRPGQRTEARRVAEYAAYIARPAVWASEPRQCPLPPEERLAEMDVRLNEAGQEVPAGGVDDGLVAPPGFRPGRCYASLADDNSTVDDVETIVHGHDRRVAYQDRIGVRPRHSDLTFTRFIDIDATSRRG